MYQPAMMAMLCIAFEKILDIAMEKDHTDIHKEIPKNCYNLRVFQTGADSALRSKTRQNRGYVISI